MLQHPFDEQKRLTDDGRPFTIEEIGTHDDVRNPGLILERQEYESLGSAWSLPCDDHPGHAHAPAVACL